MLIEIWSDVVCPWCYIGKRRFESALADFQKTHPEVDVEIAWRSFELDPSAPALRAEPMAEHLAKKYGMSLDQARNAQAQVTSAARDEGLNFDLDGAKSGNTFNAHRLIHAAQAAGLGGAMKERLLKAYFEDGLAIGDSEVLLTLAAQVGLDPDLAAQALDDDATSQAVRNDQARARELGIRGVPFYVIDNHLGVSGAQPPQAFLGALQQALDHSAPAPSAAGTGPDAPGCDDTGCAVDP